MTIYKFYISSIIKATPLLVMLMSMVTGCQAQAPSTLQPLVKTTTVRLGENSLRIKTYKYGTTPTIAYVHLHDDEKTALTATHDMLAKSGGLLIKIENSGNRLIRFRHRGRSFAFDPNRIYSRDGASNSLIASGRVSNEAIDIAQNFGNKILALVPETINTIVAVHNNTEGRFSIQSYQQGGDYATDGLAIHVNPAHDPDNIFLTTDSALFHSLQRLEYNVVLQDNLNAKRDGSLSVYCGERGIRYLNCETQHGRLTEFRQMLNAARKEIEIIGRP
jgi:hypothetical protein